MVSASSLIASFLAKRIFGYTIGEGLRGIKREVLNFFGIKTHAQTVEEQLDRVEEKLEGMEEDRGELEGIREELDEKKTELADKKDRISRFERLVQSLERKGISRQEILKKYEKPLPIICVSYTRQETEDDENFVSDVLSNKLDAVSLGGGNQVVPPHAVKREGIEDADDLQEWIEREAYGDYENGKSIIRFAVIGDLKKDVYWRDDYDFDSRYGSALGDELEITEILGNTTFLEVVESIDKAALEEIVREGDIGFFASRWLEESELNSLLAHQSEIEGRLDDRLGELNLSNLARTQSVNDLKVVLSDYVDVPDDRLTRVCEGIVDMAIIWKEELDR